MSIINVNFFSETLVRNVNFLAILPIDKRTIDNDRPWTRADKPFKTLYLLHGIHGCEYDWLTGTRIKRWAQAKNLAVIMPAGENKFYNDCDPTHDWFGKYIGEELVAFTRSMFPLSPNREDTYIGGLSMGGYGSICAGLRYPDTFGYIGAFSAALVGNNYPKDDNCIGVVKRRSQHIACLGPEEKYAGSLNDPYQLASTLLQNRARLPKMYMACGTSDSLLQSNQKYRNYLLSLKYPLDYQEDDGGHEWDFWDKQILRFLEWLPLGE